jgi:Family of unknown function (DUF5996)
MNIALNAAWPALPLDEWRDTYQTLHMWTQVVGKIALALTPPLNHFWNVALQVTPRGLMTYPLTSGHRTVTFTFDFIDQRLVVEGSNGELAGLPLQPQSVADFYRAVMTMTRELGIDVRIWPMPVEVPNPIRFDTDVVHQSYDPQSARRFWQALVAMKPVFEKFRCRFVGKSSPVHFFWGSFDLASSRFSGRRAPERPGADAITRESYSHEVISHGFWPGGGALSEPAFYAYAAPEPAGFKEAAVRPAAAYYNRDFNEFILPYQAVRTARSPETELTAFLESTYAAGAELGGWNRTDLERS